MDMIFLFFGRLGKGFMAIPVVVRRISQHHQQYHIRKPGCFGEPLHESKHKVFPGISSNIGGTPSSVYIYFLFCVSGEPVFFGLEDVLSI